MTDYRWGLPQDIEDANGAYTSYAYDTAGRLVCVAQPGDSVEGCTDPGSTAASERYTYFYAPDPPPGQPAELSWVEVERREPNRSSGYLPMIRYIDALGRAARQPHVSRR